MRRRIRFFQEVRNLSQKLSPENSRQALGNGNTNKNVNNNAYHQLNTQHNTAQQFRSPVPEQQHSSSEYNSDTQRKILTNFQQSFNEQREMYTEQAFNNYEQPLPTGNDDAHPLSETTALPTLEHPSQFYDYEKSIKTDDENPHEKVENYGGRESAGGTVIDKPANKLESDEHNSRHTFPESNSKITMGAETPGMMKLSGKMHQDRIKKDKIYLKLKEEKKTNKRISINKSNRLDNEKGDSRLNNKDKKKRLYNAHNMNDAEGAAKLERASKDVLERKKPIKRKKFSEADVNDEKLEFVRIKNKERKLGRLKYEKETVYQKQTKKAYDKKIKKQDRKEFKDRLTGRLLFSRVKSVFDDDSIQKDEDAVEICNMLKKGIRTTSFILRNNQKDLRNVHNPYARLKYITEREKYHIDKRQRLSNKNAHRQEREYVREAATKEERKRRKKEMQKVRTEREGNFIRRTQNQLKMTKRSVTYKTHKTKRTLKTAAAVGSIAGISMLSGVVVLLVILCAAQGAGEYYAEGIVQADYGTMTDATEYYRNLETDLEEYLSDKTALEAELKSEHGSDIYEFHYNICEFGFSANTILAYTAAKYNEFTLNDTVKEDLKEVFQEMYILSVYTRMENRKIDDADEQKKICYVTLKRTELEEVVESRLTEDQLKLYESYKLTTGGQQVYGPVMRENWTNLISSNYGDRIHPITKVRTTHKGVDIAVPTGTKLYSAVKGTVTVAHYSETAGNMVTIKNSTGWTVTFMHMDSIAVSVNQQVERGDFAGYSGNTGNSTGPHLHLQVNDANGNTVNPIFIIPQTCAVVNDD